MTRLGLVLPFALVCAACGSKGAVSLLANCEKPSLDVQQSALGSSLGGGFELVLELGEYAEESTEVSLGGFGLFRGDEELVSALPFSSSVDFPLSVGPGDSKRVVLSIESGDTYESGVADALCSGGIRYEGAVTDTLGGGKPTPAASAEFTPSCP
jgi:hypothetical protein